MGDGRKGIVHSEDTWSENSLRICITIKKTWAFGKRCDKMVKSKRASLSGTVRLPREIGRPLPFDPFSSEKPQFRRDPF